MATTKTDVSKAQYLLVPFTKLEIVPGLNVREDYGDMKSLTESVRQNGIITPLRGWVEKDDKGKEHYYILAGHRRFKALETIHEQDRIDIVAPFIKIDARTSDEAKLVEMFTENEGKTLTPLEQSEVVKRLLNYGWTKKDIATKFGKSDTYIARLEILASAPAKAKTLVKRNKVAAANIINMTRDGLIDKFIEKETWLQNDLAAHENSVMDEGASSAPKSSTSAPAKKTAKITAKDIMVNSWADLKRFLKAHDQTTFANKTVEDDFWLLSDVVNNALDYDDFTNYFLNGIYPSASDKSEKQNGAPKTESKKPGKANKSKSKKLKSSNGKAKDEVLEEVYSDTKNSEIDFPDLHPETDNVA